MQRTTIHLIIALCVVINFTIPLVQLSIGFHYIVKNGQDPNVQCQSAPDLPLLMAIGGIFALLFLVLGYGFVKMVAGPSKHGSDVSGIAPKVLVGMSFF